MFFSQVFVKCFQLLIHELSGIVRDDRPGESKPAYYLLEETLHLSSSDVGEALNFHPFGEVIERDQDEHILGSGGREWSYNIHSLLGERP